MGLNLCDSCRADCRHERNPREIVVKCGAYTPPMTNADRIRAMGDEELAKFLCAFRSCDSAEHPCNGCKAELYCRPGHTGMIDWLQQPEEKDEQACETCTYFPPSSCDGKPCSLCDSEDTKLDCYQRKEERND